MHSPAFKIDSSSQCAQGKEPMKSQQRQKTKRQATKQQHPKAEPEQPEKWPSTSRCHPGITPSSYPSLLDPPSLSAPRSGTRDIAIKRLRALGLEKGVGDEWDVLWLLKRTQLRQQQLPEHGRIGNSGDSSSPQARASRHTRLAQPSIPRVQCSKGEE